MHSIRSTGLLLAAAGCLGLASCATIMQGSSQQMSIASTPTGATVYVNGVQKGVTPMIANLARKDKHIIKLEMAGFEPYELPITRSVSGWVAGNLVFGGIIGLAVDASTGGMYKLAPEMVNASLAQGRVSSRVENGRDVIVVALVDRADPAWQKVGQLERE